MILQTLETNELVITRELLADLSIPALAELLLHRSSLYSAAIASHIPDLVYVNSIEREITAIHDELKRRR